MTIIHLTAKPKCLKKTKRKLYESYTAHWKYACAYAKDYRKPSGVPNTPCQSFVRCVRNLEFLLLSIEFFKRA